VDRLEQSAGWPVAAQLPEHQAAEFMAAHVAHLFSHRTAVVECGELPERSAVGIRRLGRRIAVKGETVAGAQGLVDAAVSDKRFELAGLVQPPVDIRYVFPNTGVKRGADNNFPRSKRPVATSLSVS